jgi:cytochrome P450
MLDAKDPETGDGLNTEDIADNILTFIGAGHETTALALTWTFFLLSRHPDIEQRMLEEIATVTGGNDLTAEKVSDLVYVRQVVQESMRIYPPVAMVVRQAVADMALGDEEIRAGDNVFVPIYAIHRNKTLWPDPERFDPDRFIPEAVKARHRYAYLPFAAGPRICIGMGFSLLEAAAILGVLMPKVHLASKPGFTPTPKLRVTMRPAEGMPMTMVKRAA